MAVIVAGCGSVRMGADAGTLPEDSGTIPDSGPRADGGTAASLTCAAFSRAPEGWTVATEYRATVVAEGAPLERPTGVAFVGGPFGGDAYVADRTVNTLFRLDPRSGAVTPFVAADAWPTPPAFLATLLWDAGGAFDGQLYVSDPGPGSADSNPDGNSVIFRVGSDGIASILARGPGPGLDDALSMAFSPGGSYSPGLYVSGDTDGTTPGFGRLDRNGVGLVFADYSGVDGLAVDRDGRFGGGLFAALSSSAGFAGDGTISRINPDGTKGEPLVSELPDVASLVFAPAGRFSGDAFVVQRLAGKLLRVSPGGTVSEVATGLVFGSAYGNVLAVSPDGRILLVSEAGKARVVCVEPAS